MAVRFRPPPRFWRFSQDGGLPRDVVLWLNELANRRTTPQVDSTAATVADLKADFNALLAKLRAAGLMDQ